MPARRPLVPWTEGSMEVARENVQEPAQTNLRVAQAWTDVFKKGAQQSAQAAQQGVQNAQRAAQNATARATAVK